MRNVIWWLFTVGLLLMPFSSGTGGGSYVVAYGLPFLGIAATAYALTLASRPALDRRVLGPVGLGLALSVAISIGTLIAPRLTESLARLLPNLVGFLLFVFLLSERELPHMAGALRIARLYVWSATILAAYYLAHFLLQVVQVGLVAVLWDRVTGGKAALPWGASNVVASCLIMPFFLSYALSTASTPRVIRWGYAAARLLIIGTIALTLSRAAVLAVVVGLFAMIVAGDGSQRRRMLGSAVAAFVVFLAIDNVLNNVLSQQIIAGLFSRFGDRDVLTLNTRTEKYGAFFNLFRASPIVGIGYYGSIATVGGTGHNLLTTTLAERGILGLLFSAPILIVAAWRTLAGWWSATDTSARALFFCCAVGGMSAVLHLFFEDANFTHQYIVYSWVAFALVFVAAAEHRADRIGRSGVPSDEPAHI